MQNAGHFCKPLFILSDVCFLMKQLAQEGGILCSKKDRDDRRKS